MSLFLRKGLSFGLILSIILGNVFIFGSIPTVSAAPDPDGSANIDLFVSPTVPTSSLIGTSFTYNVSLENRNTSDGDGYRPGFILALPS